MSDKKQIDVIVNDCVAGHWFPDPNPKQGYSKGSRVTVDPDNPRVQESLELGIVRPADAKPAKE